MGIDVDLPSPLSDTHLPLRRLRHAPSLVVLGVNLVVQGGPAKAGRYILRP